MRTLRMIMAMLLSSWLIGCGSSQTGSELTDPSSENHASRYVAIDEQPITTTTRGWSQDMEIPSPGLDQNKAYLATLVYEDNQEQLVKVAPQGTILKLMLSQTKLRDGLYPTKCRLYRLGIDLDTPARVETICEISPNRSVSNRPVVILVHGILSNNSKMEALRRMFVYGILPNDQHVRYITSEAYAYEYNDLQPITKSSEGLWHFIHDEVIKSNTRKRVVIIAHSQGGLVSRHAIERRGMSYDVNQLIMLGTPNNGASILGFTTTNVALLGWFTNNLTLLAFAFTVELAVPALTDLGYDSNFIKDLNQPSHTDVNYHTIAGTHDNLGNVLSDSDGIVAVDSCNWSGLSNEGTWDRGQKVPLRHTELPVNNLSLAKVQRILELAYPEISGDSNAPTGNTSGPSSGSTTAGTSASPTSGGTTGGNTSPAPTTTITQTVLTHPASEWDYGQNGFWHSEGKWHAAARRVDVGPPLEPVQMDGRDGRLKSGVSGRGFSCQRCRNGILVNLGSDVLGIKGEFYDHYRQRGGPTGELGCLTTEQKYDQRSGVSGRNGEWAQFEGGFLTKFDGLTATVLGDFARVWNGKGKGQGEVGYPQDFRRSVKSGAPQFVNTSGGWGQYQPFEGGSISEWSQTEHVVTGGFDREYRRVGGPGGPLGYPQTAKRTGVRSGCSARRGEEQIFQFGRIGELGVNNAWAVYGEILKRYSGPEYHHGFPLGPSENNNHRQRFEEYYISW